MSTTQPPDLHTLTARRFRRNLPPGWRILSVRPLPCYGWELWGAAPIGFISRGPRKGQPKWPPQREWLDVVISIQEVEDTRLQWEAETGLCSWCGSSGRYATGVECPHCCGTGKAGGGL